MKNGMTRLTEKELRLSQLKTMRVIHDYCYETGLKYYLVYGTLLGSVRHKGYIPWDDDIDIAMPRHDYDVFIHNFNQVSKRVGAKCVHIDLDSRYYLDFAKVYDTQTLLTESVYRPISIGAYIDIFPIDVMPEDIQVATEILTKIRVKELELRKHNSVGAGNGRTIKTLFHNITRLSLKDKREDTIKGIDSLGKSFEGTKSGYVAIAVGGFPLMKEYVPKEWYGEPQLVEFERELLYAPAKCHELLTRWYGDYMTLPPIEEQCTHHSFEAYWR